MNTSISVDIGSVDFYFRDLAAAVTEESLEEDFLRELARALRNQSVASGDEQEKQFCLDAAEKCAELAKWFKENGEVMR